MPSISEHGKIEQMEMSDFRTDDSPKATSSKTNSNVWFGIGLVVFVAFVFFGYSRTSQPLKMKNSVIPEPSGPKVCVYFYITQMNYSYLFDKDTSCHHVVERIVTVSGHR